MNTLPPVGLPGTAAPSPVPAPASPTAAPPAADAVTLGGPQPPGVDLAQAARILAKRPQCELEKGWTIEGTCCGSPVRGPQGEIYVSRAYKDEVASLDPSDGHVVWKATPGGGHSTPPLLCPDGTLVVGGKDHRLHGINRDTGDVMWSVPIPGGLGRPFLGEDGKVYFVANGHLTGFDLQRHEVASQTPLGGHEFEDHPVVGKDGTIYGGGHDGALYALEPNTGHVKWHSPSGGMLRNSPAIGPDGTVYAGCIGAALVAFEPADGREKWRFPTPQSILPSPVVMEDGTVLAGCGDKHLYAIDPATGKQKWAFEMDGEVRTGPAPCRDGIIYAVSDGNTLFGIDAATGTSTWKAKAPSYVHCPLAPDGNGTFVFGSNDHTTVAMRGSRLLQTVLERELVEASQSPPPAPPPTIEVQDDWIVVGGVRVPVRPHEG